MSKSKSFVPQNNFYNPSDVMSNDFDSTYQRGRMDSFVASATDHSDFHGNVGSGFKDIDNTDSYPNYSNQVQQKILNPSPYGFQYKDDIYNVIYNTPHVFKGVTKFFILKSNSQANL